MDDDALRYSLPAEKREELKRWNDHVLGRMAYILLQPTKVAEIHSNTAGGATVDLTPLATWHQTPTAKKYCIPA
jgi:hypothetical protein